MSTARLADLQRQRRLLQEHLDWLDLEIAAEKAAAASPLAAASLPGALPAAPASPPTQGASPEPASQPARAAGLKEPEPEALARANALADSLLKEYRANNPDTPESTRRSCLLLLLAFGLFGVAGLMGLYWFYYR